MAIKGSIREARLPDVAKILALGRKTGLLSITNRQKLGKMYFKDGRIVYSSMVNREVRFGELLLRAGKISEEQLERGLGKQRSEEGKRIGEILVEMGVISKETLETYVVRQIKDTVSQLLTWKDGYFHFQSDLLPTSEPITISLDPEELIVDGEKEAHELVEMEKELPSRNTILKTVPEVLQGLQLTDDDAHIVALTNGVRTIDDVVEQSVVGEFKTLEIIRRMLRQGLAVKAGVRIEGTASAALKRVEEHLKLGIAFFKTEMYDEAKRELRKALEIDRTVAEAHFYLGMIEYLQSSYPGAAEEFEKAREFDPERVSILNNLGLALEKLGRLEEAAEVYLRAKGIAPDDATVDVNLASVKRSMGALAEAEDALKRAMDKDERLLSPYFYLPLIYLETGDYRQAAAYLKKGIEKEPEIPEFHSNLALVLEKTGEVDEAEREYARAIELHPGLLKPHRNLGELYYERGNYERALKEFELLVEKGESDFGLFLRLGDAYYRSGQRDRAIEAWEKAEKLQPGNPLVQKSLELARSR